VTGLAVTDSLWLWLWLWLWGSVAGATTFSFASGPLSLTLPATTVSGGVAVTLSGAGADETANVTFGAAVFGAGSSLVSDGPSAVFTSTVSIQAGQFSTAFSK
jgi:hypothetical protein